ncbi:hypothetical protein AB0I30_32810 [Nocardia tengchongensis]|uniref:hypothetical protein n=1 Tax=Nocardia tengchongensis TaxID=2055889 RepID=UPI0033E7E36D
MTARESAVPVVMSECAGLWQRTLLVDTDGAPDTTTDVRWLQGLTRFVDLRRPMPRPDYSEVRCAAELTGQQRAWLRMQDGFAGVLTQSGDVFHWQRRIELQAPGPFPDEGRMSRSGDVLVEIGVHADYFEHWARSEVPDTCWAMDLESPDGDRAILLRAGDRFGWAHLDSAGAVELSLGDVAHGEWVITDSCLPYREGHLLQPRWKTASETGNTLFTSTIDAEGAQVTPQWIVRYTEGNVIV